jgi:hypothetical protein
MVVSSTELVMCHSRHESKCEITKEHRHPKATGLCRRSSESRSHGESHAYEPTKKNRLPLVAAQTDAVSSSKEQPKSAVVATLGTSQPKSIALENLNTVGIKIGAEGGT